MSGTSPAKEMPLNEIPKGLLTWTDRLAVTVTDAVMARPWLVIIGSLLVVLSLASGARFLEIANNYRVFFSPDNPDLVAFETFQDTYTKSDNIMFVLKPEDGRVFTPERAKVIEELTAEAWKIPYAIRVDSLSTFQHTYADGDELIVGDLLRDADRLTLEQLSDKRDIAQAEPLIDGYLLARDAGATGINVTLQFPEKSLTEVPEAMAFARKLAAEVEAKHPDLEVALTGVAALNNAFAESSQADGTTLYPIMFLVLVAVTYLILRSWSATAATIALITLATLAAMGTAGYAGISITPISSAAPIVILTLAIADSIHILVTFLGLLREGATKRQALRESLRINFLAVAITSLTTIVGFLALNFADAPPYHDLGNIAAAGIAAAFLLSVTFLPAVMTLLPVRVKAGAAGTKSVGERAMRRLARFTVRRYRALLVAGGGISVGLALLIPTIDLNDEWIQYFDHRIEFRNDAEFAIEHLTGLYAIEFSVKAPEAGGVNEPAFLTFLERYTEWLRRQPGMRHVYSYADIIKRLNRNLHADDPAFHKIPDDRELAAQYLLLFELSLPFGLDLNDRISVDKSATRLTATFDQIPTRETRAFLERSAAWVAANAPDGVTVTPTGPTVMFSHISERNISDMTTGNLVAVALISVIMMLALRHWALGALSLIPNAFPILMTFGLWALLSGQVGMAGAMVSATSLGIIVDDTVHFLTKYLRARREKRLKRPEAVEYAFTTVGLALVANTVILALGFAVLAFSSFKVTMEMGLLTTIAVIMAVLFDFLVLPALLLVGHRKKDATADPSSSDPKNDRNDPSDDHVPVQQTA